MADGESTKTIMVVDDEESVCFLYREELEEEGYAEVNGATGQGATGQSAKGEAA